MVDSNLLFSASGKFSFLELTTEFFMKDPSLGQKKPVKIEAILVSREDLKRKAEMNPSENDAEKDENVTDGAPEKKKGKNDSQSELDKKSDDLNLKGKKKKKKGKMKSVIKRVFKEENIKTEVG